MISVFLVFTFIYFFLLSKFRNSDDRLLLFCALSFRLVLTVDACATIRVPFLAINARQLTIIIEAKLLVFVIIIAIATFLHYIQCGMCLASLRLLS